MFEIEILVPKLHKKRCCLMVQYLEDCKLSSKPNLKVITEVLLFLGHNN